MYLGQKAKKKFPTVAPLVGAIRKIKNVIERADQGSFYFSLFSQFYMHQTNKLRKEKSKNSLKYNYEKGENK